MIIAICIVFILGYMAIALEHPLKVNKAASALLTAVICWAILVLGNVPQELFASESFHHFLALFKIEKGTDFVEGLTQHEQYVDYAKHSLSHHLAEISEILFFLMGAMTIVELIDAHQGFKVITNRIKTKDSRKLLWIISILAFFLSAVLDNLTTSIVMVSLLKKLVHNKQQRMFFAGMVIVAANAGGAWSPIGDVTTTMLWIGGQITAANIIKTVFIPSVICMVIPLIYLSFKMKGEVERAEYDYDAAEQAEVAKGSKLMLFLGVGALLFVPVFKTITHLPPYMGMLFGLGLMWVVSELLHVDKTEEEKKPYSAIHALTKIDVPSVLFFLGILVAISSLQSLNVLRELALWMNDTIGRLDVIVMAIGVLSAIVDNVPLVAASMGMYDMAVYPQDHWMWEFMAYCAGTGGSMLIIGSAAGVAVMGMEKIDFIWYMKKITLLALLGYFAGAITYLAMHWSAVQATIGG